MSLTVIICIAIILLFTVTVLIESHNGEFLFKRQFKGKVIRTQQSQREIVKILYEICLYNNFSIEFCNAEKGQFLLSQPTTLLYGGIFYPIRIESESEQETVITVGAKSKLIFAGVLIFKNHKKLYSLIQLAIEALEQK